MRIKSTLLRSLAATALAVGAGVATIVVAPASAQAGWFDDLVNAGTSTGTGTTTGGDYEPVPVPSTTISPNAPGRVYASTSCVWANAVRVNWNQPSSRYSIQNYDVRAYQSSTGREVSARTVNGYTRSWDLTGLRPGTRYQIKVRAKNSAGWGEWSSPDYVTTGGYYY
ncbi:hypothetical protein GCM10010124_28810 [Pilimelia terevasa]|uniref:Fibronectin type-III domain-containing protein n=1 Tax=Pilimelia terevasa TaxID=53372 RepID=A0A8J3FJ04_9ACTN|nr:fibronectin type III domain-containing protein [Pilimelia terevasa]GGK34434.1 hypothetical protein GCM10010124_28810 [Pilimelia terevasa]